MELQVERESEASMQPVVTHFTGAGEGRHLRKQEKSCTGPMVEYRAPAQANMSKMVHNSVLFLLIMLICPLVREFLSTLFEFAKSH